MSESIVVGTDGSDSAERAVDEAIRLAKALDCEIHIVSAYKPLRGAKVEGGTAEMDPPGPEALVDSTLEQAAARVRSGGVKVDIHAVEAEPADALLKIAGDVQASLVVVGSRGMHGARRVLGSVPNTISHSASCNVLIVSTDQS
jgi:nucleotide-binding universal stress UspA family protein